MEWLLWLLMVIFMKWNMLISKMLCSFAFCLIYNSESGAYINNIDYRVDIEIPIRFSSNFCSFIIDFTLIRKITPYQQGWFKTYARHTTKYTLKTFSINDYTKNSYNVRSVIKLEGFTLFQRRETSNYSFPPQSIEKWIQLRSSQCARWLTILLLLS